MSRPFNTSLRRGAGEPHDLIARVEAEVRDRIAEAVDFVCLESMVDARRAGGLPAPAADSTSDRAEFDRRVQTFLARLGDAMLPVLDPEQRQALTASGRVTGDPLDQLIAVQVSLAKLLPDYWQRFEQVRTAYALEAGDPAPTSSRDRPGWLDRLFGR
ncbi:MAG TPA: hypothetical protein VK548_05950 [Candidatus Acidoferrum sp.]|nr:hypothetical protein [Candidatus Acidoferrum sp.]